MYLSRYASESIGYWEDRLVWELQDAHAELSRIIRLENGDSP